MLKIGAQLTMSPNLQARLDGELDRFARDLVREAFGIARSITPRRSGKARRAWRLEGRGKNTEAVNQVPYIERLDQGSSRQAPQGILKPTVKRLRGQTRRITR